ncbi:hypothetical protein CAPTEDRAFT_195547 [Capitella teleta]|uniref:Uncharacterized protein n=1 Tax=Capitella teleta TaxID=283909 RepID=R7UI87_CAPTE|nr:hypothetical protein CAPTEDRAFT_195547 [Capitella teleta]|eukprot:ELU02957.1 hypothetical protein CAPTEDRAFT_195547 [Capitella teleta]
MDKKRRGAENLSTFMDDVMPTPQCKENIEAAVAHPLQMLAEKKALTKENKMKRKLEATANECQENETQEQTEQVLKICSELEFVSCYCAGAAILKKKVNEYFGIVAPILEMYSLPWLYPLVLMLEAKQYFKELRMFS